MTDEWKPAASPLMTKWAADVDPRNVLPEYPRPQLVRDQWTNLNGLWEYAIVGRDDARPTTFDGAILVPFAIESALSGVGRRVTPEQSLWYRRTFATTQTAAGERAILHFGGVDWQAHVYVNGALVAEHSGGHTPFAADVTDALKPGGENELVVKVWDPTDAGSQPRGKQVREPRGIWYTPVTGIWQTVWMETVPATSIARLKLTPDLDAGTLRVETTFRGDAGGIDVVVAASDGSTPVASASGAGDALITLSIPDAKRWSPDAPFLYDLVVTLKRDGAVVDSVKSYFAMRKVSKVTDAAGHPRIALNDVPLFLFGPLDQGWWPDGLYTAPTDEALRWDVEFTKKLGFNMCRKHIKVEPARWYYWCDKLGLAVWQDQSSGMAEGRDQSIKPGTAEDAVFSPIEKVQFVRELREMMDALHNCPSIVAWVPFNEGWGQHDTNDVLKWTKAYDPTRLVDGPSGWEDRGFGDLYDMHLYPGPGMFPTSADRISVLGEYGGLGLPVDGHLWQAEKNWGYRTLKATDELGDRYAELAERLVPLARRGLAAAIYTQTTDVEGEVNGFATYDRKVEKFDAARVAALSRKVIAAANDPVRVVELAPTSHVQPQAYAFTLDKPADGWERPDFDASRWTAGEGDVGTVGRAEWTGEALWLRRTIALDRVPTCEAMLNVRHDGGVAVYLNGALAYQSDESVGSYELVSIAPAARATLRAGENVIAISARRRDGGGAFVDVGLSSVEPVGR